MTKRNIITIALISIFSLVGVVSIGQSVFAAKCGGVDTAIIDCGTKEGEEAIFDVIAQAIKILNYGIGILAIGGVIVGGIMYTSSGSSPESLKRAKTIWINVGIGLALYATLVTLTNFLIPGGVFS
jgi:hypothetical protein